MTQIRYLFDAGKDIQRTIEKVITYQASQEQRLKAEISEYIATESIEQQLEQLLEKMQAAMEAGSSHEVGVWVSGFYGSGKSSFTKYLGLAFDQRVTIDGKPFLRHLQDRLHRPTTKALLSKLAASFPAAVVMLDLASEQIAGASLAEVSTVLYHKVLQYAGYSRNVKVAALERRLRKEGRYTEFEQAFQNETGEKWADYRNDDLVVDSVVPRLAHKLYPNLFLTDQAFSTASTDIVYLMNDRVQEMIDVVCEASGKEHIIFIVDEIGQYVGSQQTKILDLQGLAQNLKDLGNGKVWIVGTAQQTLTEDDPRAAINSPELYKLKDRFPITVALESSDIKEICFRRLLGKSAVGAAELGALFDRHGQALRQHTKLSDAKFYDAGFDRETFTNLYPFLPAHFDILLHLLGALAKSTGGIGLRSAIKVIQDILVEGAGSLKAVVDRQLGWLATTVTLYDALDKDIRRAFPSIHQAVDKVLIRFPDEEVSQGVGKTVAVLQILGNLPVSVENVAALMQPAIAAGSLADEVKGAIDRLLKDPIVPLGEKDGWLRFFSEKLNDVEQERSQLAPRTPDIRRVFHEALKAVFDPLPSVRLHGSLTVTTGLKHLNAGQQVSLAGERETVQSILTFADPTDYETEKTRLNNESIHRSSENSIYLLARRSGETDDLVADICRCERIVELHRNDPDQEVKEYCQSQMDRASRLNSELIKKIARSLTQGSFVFRGKVTAVDSLDQSLATACKKHLAEAAERVFDRYPEAAERAATDLAEKFLRAPNLRAVSSALDPLGLVQVSGGSPSIKTDHKGLISIKDFIERNGTVEGKKLLDVFSGAPFGWSQDTLRYMVAALLVAGEVKLKVSGREVTVTGQQAIDALKNNNSFKSAGVAMRDDRPSMEVLGRAAERLTDLSGDQVVPLEEDIGKAAQKLLPSLQHQLAPLAERLQTLGLPGVETVRSANQQIADMLLSDASDAPQRFGAEQSPLYDALKWAIAAKLAFDHGIADTIKALRSLQRGVDELPNTGAPKELRDAAGEDLAAVADILAQDDFFKRKADLNTRKTTIEARVAEAVAAMHAAQAERLLAAESELALIPEWSEFTVEEQAGTLSKIQALSVEVMPDIAGVQKLVARQFDIEVTIAETKAKVVQEGKARRQQVLYPKTSNTSVQGVQEKRKKTITIPARIATPAELDALIRTLSDLRRELSDTDLDFVVQEN
ncbi:BREX system P-loop protein BrxC [Bradyrhizobium sp. CW9]|uniref:BREX system P-loop protein BrxC n=1 Tax=Bradyrhizobium sp. CW9 TaxID=2782689 RepID=UPI001FFBC7B8|nr:BREX system P-loop protein BrxC [Bradyrhizobium sp. CW9]MCK1328617.1 BREX system P-loop protein BrxC [Bradyrhizobium sp. CW9]